MRTNKVCPHNRVLKKPYSTPKSPNLGGFFSLGEHPQDPRQEVSYTSFSALSIYQSLNFAPTNTLNCKSIGVDSGCASMLEDLFPERCVRAMLGAWFGDEYRARARRDEEALVSQPVLMRDETRRSGQFRAVSPGIPVPGDEQPETYSRYHGRTGESGRGGNIRGINQVPGKVQ
jgi:hypothetical protein